MKTVVVDGVEYPVVKRGQGVTHGNEFKPEYGYIVYEVPPAAPVKPRTLVTEMADKLYTSERNFRSAYEITAWLADAVEERLQAIEKKRED